MKLNFFSVIIVIININLFMNCATLNSVDFPSTNDLRSADYSEKPEKYEEEIKNHLELILADAPSAIYKNWVGPKKNWYKETALSSPIYGWSVCVLINSKNTVGGYNGFKTYGFLFRKQRIIISTIKQGNTHFNDLLCEPYETEFHTPKE